MKKTILALIALIFTFATAADVNAGLYYDLPTSGTVEKQMQPGDFLPIELPAEAVSYRIAYWRYGKTVVISSSSHWGAGSGWNLIGGTSFECPTTETEGCLLKIDWSTARWPDQNSAAATATPTPASVAPTPQKSSVWGKVLFFGAIVIIAIIIAIIVVLT